MSKTIRIVLDLTPKEVEDLDNFSWAEDTGPPDEGYQSADRKRLREKIQAAIEVAKKAGIQ